MNIQAQAFNYSRFALRGEKTEAANLKDVYT
jgi:hypothetical protein